MLSDFLQFSKENQLFSQSDKLLLAVSGGIDSMVMLHLFQLANIPFSVAHCNFSLRGEESNGDQAFVEQQCAQYGIPLHIKVFNTNAFAKENKLSIQVAARELRYGWFTDLCVEHGYTKVAIAHNNDDVAETVLINLTRGTGLKGLTGIKAVNGKYIRPILFASRNDIKDFANANSFGFREDSTNATVKYARNRIRHNVLPELSIISGTAKQSIYNATMHLQEAWQIIDSEMQRIKQRVVKEVGLTRTYSIPLLNEEAFGNFFLREDLNQLGFSAAIANQIIDNLDAQSGKVFRIKQYQLVKDRKLLVVSPIISTNMEEVLIDEQTHHITNPIELTLERKGLANETIDKSPMVAMLDAAKLSFPLTLRPWQKGDKFSPLGMNGFKKVSDYLIDKKIPLHEKEHTMVLCSNNDIVWLVGHRIDNRFKISPTTETILKIVKRETACLALRRD
ncbi:MAG: tRNA lysidine(34) synthetase TilS [Bacteroidales bacterium]|nr:tRNA lysidine(34) synthetase TilS [Bacteroidales bacterium]